MSNNIAGKVVVITGASSGLGEATARLLSAQSASVALGARRVDRLKSLADELTKTGGKALALATDVTNSDQVKQLVGAAVQKTPLQIFIASLVALQILTASLWAQSLALRQQLAVDANWRFFLGDPAVAVVQRFLVEDGEFTARLEYRGEFRRAQPAVAGLGVDILSLIPRAVDRGGHIREGLEDAPWGSTLSNAAWVAAAASWTFAVRGGFQAIGGRIRNIINAGWPKKRRVKTYPLL